MGKSEERNLNSENIQQLYSLYLLPSTIYFTPYALLFVPFLSATRNPKGDRLFCKHLQVTFMPYGVVLKMNVEHRTSNVEHRITMSLRSAI